MFICLVILFFFNKLNFKNFLPYLYVVIFLWEFTHQSGIHATISGVLLALTIPHKSNKRDKSSLLLKLEHSISPYVAFGIMPIFAFANAGVSLEGINISSIMNSVPLGILWAVYRKTSRCFYIFICIN